MRARLFAYHFWDGLLRSVKMGQVTSDGKKASTSISNRRSNSEKIIDMLGRNNSGLTVADISKLLTVTRNTVAICLARLEGAQRIEIRKVGKAKLYSLKPEIQTKLGD